MQKTDSTLTKTKPRLPAIEYIRGISMMGVIGIHVGSQYIGNPSANAHLTALFEIFTRFSVPIFFFISALTWTIGITSNSSRSAGRPCWFPIWSGLSFICSMTVGFTVPGYQAPFISLAYCSSALLSISFISWYFCSGSTC